MCMCVYIYIYIYIHTYIHMRVRVCKKTGPLAEKNKQHSWSNNTVHV